MAIYMVVGTVKIKTLIEEKASILEVTKWFDLFRNSFEESYFLKKNFKILRALL